MDAPEAVRLQERVGWESGSGGEQEGARHLLRTWVGDTREREQSTRLPRCVVGACAFNISGA